MLPDNILQCMDPLERRKLGKAGRTAAEAQAKGERELEKADQRDFRNFCLLKGIWPGDQRMDKRSTAKKGSLDFACAYGGRCLFLEFKHGSRKLTPEQEETMRFHQATGNPAFVVHSVSEAIEQCYEFLLPSGRRQ